METAMIQEPEFQRTQTTDPREAKLKDIIEKGRASLHKALEEIQHEFSIREDMAVRPTAIDFLVQDHKIQPVIRDEAYDLTEHSQTQMLTRAGIPASFAQRSRGRRTFSGKMQIREPGAEAFEKSVKP